MKHTIMHLISTSFFGGPEKQISEHLQLIKKRQTYNGILASFIEGNMDNETLFRAKNSGLRHCEIRMSNPFDFKAMLKLKKKLKSERVDLLCAHGYKAVVMGCIAARWANIPVLAFSRGYTSENKKVRFYEWLERKFLEKCNGIICVSNGQREKLNSLKVKGKRFWVVHNAVNTEESVKADDIRLCSDIKRELNIPSQSLMIVTAGRLSPEKGHHYLMQAIGLLSNKLPNAYFIFCGDGQCKEDLQRVANDLTISERCRFVGFRKDLDVFMQCMDIFVLPSLTEGLPNVILESFSHAKPVVATDVGGVPELVTHQKNGLLVAPQRSDLLADSILGLANNPESRVEMGRAGYYCVKNHFSFIEQNKKLENIYHQIFQ